jgi:hypothetical protein
LCLQEGQAFYIRVDSADSIAGLTCAPVPRTAPRRVREDQPLKPDLFDFKDLTQRVLGAIGIRENDLKELFRIKVSIDLNFDGYPVSFEIVAFLFLGFQVIVIGSFQCDLE